MCVTKKLTRDCTLKPEDRAAVTSYSIEDRQVTCTVSNSEDIKCKANISSYIIQNDNIYMFFQCLLKNMPIKGKCQNVNFTY